MIKYITLEPHQLTDKIMNQLYKISASRLHGFSYLKAFLIDVEFRGPIHRAVIVAAKDTETGKFVGWGLLKESNRALGGQSGANMTDLNIYIKRPYRKKGIAKKITFRIAKYRSLHLDKFVKRRYYVYDTDCGGPFWRKLSPTLKQRYNFKISIR